MHPNTSVWLMNIVSNFVFHCNNCDANRVFVKLTSFVIVKYITV